MDVEMKKTPLYEAVQLLFYSCRGVRGREYFLQTNFSRFIRNKEICTKEGSRQEHIIRYTQSTKV